MPAVKALAIAANRTTGTRQRSIIVIKTSNVFLWVCQVICKVLGKFQKRIHPLSLCPSTALDTQRLAS